MATAQLKQPSLAFLDGLRGLAAFYVMVGHARWLLWEGYSDGFVKHPENYSFLGKLIVYFMSLFTYGHEVVLFFFVLSGFVIHLKNAQQLKEGKQLNFSISRFYKRRFLRLYPAFIFSLLLTFALDSSGAFLQFPIYFAGTPNAQINQNITHLLDWNTLFGNVLMVQNVYCKTFGSNGPNWSLMFEWWFYLFYPAFLFLAKRSIVPSTLLIVLLFILSFIPGIWPIKLLQVVFTMMICWWTGVFLAEVYVNRIATISTKALQWLLLSFPLGFYLKLIGATSCLDLVWALSFCGLLAFFLSYKLSALKAILSKLKWLGDCSYTLYIIHFPIFVFFSGWILSIRGELPASFGYVVFGILVVTAFSWLLHFIIEKPFHHHRSRRKAGIIYAS